MGSDNNTHDVFISFRGPDTRNTFVSHLYAHLISKGVFAFKDDTQLQKGESISPQLLQAIQHSRVSIVVFSKDYAASTWCLDEMAAIAECRTQLKQTTFPVFYDVDPSHVRKQNGVYKNAFDLHTEQFKHDPAKVDRWKRAMTCLAGSAGWDVRNKPESEEIENIVQHVIKRLGHRFSGFSDDLIGIQSHIEALESLLKLSAGDDDGFRVLGIWGMGGVGKTTLANVLYDRISYQFDACCFIENVSKTYTNGGAIAVQKQILCRTIKEKNLEAHSPSEISAIVTKRLHNIKLLVVLDNVDQYEQLDELHIKPKLLCSRSRIIIITRDVHILRQYGADMVYEAQLMSDNDARELLCRKAFKSGYSSSTCAKLIPEVLKYARGLPLAIKVIGSFLCTRNAMQWRATLDELQDNQPDEIMKVLQTSFEGLNPREREIFLHVACFFEGEREDYVRQVLEACGLHPDIRIPCLAEKSLIMIRNQEIHMHEMLQELGKEIVRREHPDEPRLWSRLWLYRDFHRMMMTEMEPRHFRCGFDVVLPWDWKTYSIPREFNHQFKGDSIIRIKHSNMPVDWIGFLFCAAFEVNNPPTVSGSPHHLPSSPLPHPFYLSFESEHTEERFDMPLSLERNKVDGSNYLWTIYISREHCHFVNTGAQITFKACQGLIVKEWGLSMLTKEDVLPFVRTLDLPLEEVIDNREESSSSIEGKIQLPYNWLVSDEDKDENDDAKRKETNLCNLGLLTGRPQ